VREETSVECRVASEAMRLERVGDAAPGTTDRDSRITDGAISPDGQWVVLRSQRSLRFFRTADLLAGRWHDASRVDLAPLNEPQGEGVAIDANNTVFVAGEAGRNNQGGTFARFSCAPRE
jgi:hypothetical protein